MCYAATVRSNFVGYLHRKTLVWVFSQLSLGFFKWIASCFNTFKRLQLHLCSLSGFDSHSWKTQVKCVQKKYFSYIIDKIVSYRRNFSKILVIQAYFFFFFKLFSLLVYISLAFHLEDFQNELFCFSVIKMCKFGISMVNIRQIVWEPMKDHLCHMRKVAKHFHNKKKMFIYLTLLMFN